MKDFVKIVMIEQFRWFIYVVQTESILKILNALLLLYTRYNQFRKKVLNCTYLYLNIDVLGILQETAEPIRKENRKSGQEFFSMKLRLSDTTGTVDVYVIGNEEHVRCILIKQNCICKMLAL